MRTIEQTGVVAWSKTCIRASHTSSEADDNVVTLDALDMNTEKPAGDGNSPLVLRLYVCGIGPRTESAVANLRHACEHDLRAACSLEVIDVLEQPDLAEEAKVLATPTLIKLLPPPLRRIIGDLSDTQKLLVGLEIGRRAPSPQPHPEIDSA